MRTNRKDNNTMNFKKSDIPDEPEVRHSIWRQIRMTLICMLVLGGGIAGASYMTKTAPKASKRPPVKTVPLVKAVPVYPGGHTVMVPAMGTVLPARKMLLKSRVTGEVTAIHPEFITGGTLKAGDKILNVDPKDYQLAVVQKQGEVADADYALRLELGYQVVAKREWELLNGNKPAQPADTELALRKPHLAKARADLKAANSDLEQARVNLARTRIYSPFNAFVRTKNVELGSQVAPQEQLAELVSTDEYWIQVSLPVDLLKWISISGNAGELGSKVRISYQKGSERMGSVIKLLGDLETDGRMARLLVSVKDPLGLKELNQPPLLIGEYVRVKIEGAQLDNVYSLPRTALRNGQELWIAGSGGKLEIRNVKTLWRDADTVLLAKGLKPGDQLIISDLGNPVEQMPIKIENSPLADVSGNNRKGSKGSISK